MKLVKTRLVLARLTGLVELGENDGAHHCPETSALFRAVKQSQSPANHMGKYPKFLQARVNYEECFPFQSLPPHRPTAVPRKEDRKPPPTEICLCEIPRQ